MDFEQALVYELQLISGLEGKVFPQKAEDETRPPFVVYMSSDGEPIMTLSGPTNLTELTCEIHIICDSYEQLKSKNKAVIGRINSFFQRTIGQDGPYIKSISHTEPVENINDNTEHYSSSFDMRIRF